MVRKGNDLVERKRSALHCFEQGSDIGARLPHRCVVGPGGSVQHQDGVDVLGARARRQRRRRRRWRR
eukprot:3578199-Prymnesium_polylepis.1